MPNPYPAEISNEQSTVTVGDIVFTDPDNQPGGGLDLEGSGSPLGTVTASSIGCRYTDIDDGALYLALNADNASWVLIGGSGDPDAAGVYSTTSEAQLQEPSGASVRVFGGQVRILPGADQVVQIFSHLSEAIEVQDDGTHSQIGFYAAPPVTQPAAITAPTGGTVIDVQARAAIDAILAAIGAAAGGIGITA
jgi:hypothetical protein